ncbi:tetratricopeptide repeat protein [Hyphomonas beringensis]|nr:hypothetical protein [Hyphomonas beringensis]
MRSTVRAFLLSGLFGLAAIPALAGPDIYRAGTSPASECADELARTDGASLRLLHLCDEGAAQPDLTAKGRAAALANAGTVRLRLGNLEEAVIHLSKAQDLGAPKDSVISLSAALIRLERAEEAATLLSDLNGVSPDLMPTALYNRATAQLQRDNTKAAYLDLLEATRLAPDYAPAQELLTHFTVTPYSAMAEAGEEERDPETDCVAAARRHQIDVFRK